MVVTPIIWAFLVLRLGATREASERPGSHSFIRLSLRLKYFVYIKLGEKEKQ